MTSLKVGGEKESLSLYPSRFLAETFLYYKDQLAGENQIKFRTKAQELHKGCETQRSDQSRKLVDKAIIIVKDWRDTGIGAWGGEVVKSQQGSFTQPLWCRFPVCGDKGAFNPCGTGRGVPSQGRLSSCFQEARGG